MNAKYWMITEWMPPEELRAKLYGLGEDRYPDLWKMLNDQLAQVETALKRLQEVGIAKD